MENLLLVLLIFIVISTIILFILYYKRGKQIEELEQYTLKNEELKSRFLTHFCQVLRFPLNGINESFLIIENKDLKSLSENDLKKLRDNIHNNYHLMLIYLNELQELTNFQGVIPSLSAIEVNLTELVMSYRREIMHETRPGVSVLLHTSLSPHTKATFDTTMFRQLIMHLLRLGAQRTKEGTISINYEHENHGLRFILSDTGYPISEDIRKVLFTDQFKDELITHLDVRTTHVSIDMCKFIIDSMRGTIKALPGENGLGITISFWFPCPVNPGA